MQEVFDDLLPLGAHNYQIKFYTLSVTLWTLWTIRNKISIEKLFLGNSNEAFYKIFTFLQK